MPLSPPLATGERETFVNTSVQLRRRQVEEVNRLARDEGLSRADIIRRALDVGLGFRAAPTLAPPAEPRA
jgi:hypothetical protein